MKLVTIKRIVAYNQKKTERLVSKKRKKTDQKRRTILTFGPDGVGEFLVY